MTATMPKSAQRGVSLYSRPSLMNQMVKNSPRPICLKNSTTATIKTAAVRRKKAHLPPRLKRQKPVNAADKAHQQPNHHGVEVEGLPYGEGKAATACDHRWARTGSPYGEGKALAEKLRLEILISGDEDR